MGPSQSIAPPLADRAKGVQAFARLARHPTKGHRHLENVHVRNQGHLSPKTVIDGKPLIIHAAILDKPEMILLLATYGAMTIDPVCEEGKNIMEYAQENNSILAQAQIIIIRA